MQIILIIVGLAISYVVIQAAVDHSLNTRIMRENHKLLVEIRNLLKNQNKLDNK